jgi:hypothetical protein
LNVNTITFFCRHSRSAFLLLLAAVSVFPAARVSAQQVQTDPEVHEAVRQDISPAVRDLPLADLRKLKPNRAPEVGTIPGFFKNEALRGMDAAIQQKPAASKPFGGTIGLNFDGTVNVDGVTPGDTNGSVGDTQYVQWVNLSFSVYDKKTGKLLKGPVAGNSLWAGFGGQCQSNNNGDILVNYDKQAKRWVFTQFALNGPFLQCFAVSTTSDALGKFNRYAFTVSNSLLNDYPKIGIWPDAYYMSFNMFGNGQAKACAYDRSNMLRGAKATSVCFQRQLPDFSLLPSDMDGLTAPPTGEPNFYVELDQDQKHLDLYKFHVDFAKTNKSTFTGPTKIAISPWKQINGVAEGHGGDTLDTLGDRLMYRLAYRNFNNHETLTAAHTVDRGDGNAGVRWYEIRNPNATPQLFQQSTFTDPAKVSVWMPGLAMDKAGDMVLGMSRASTAVFPGVSLTGRLVTDPINTMETSKVAVAGGDVMNPGNGGRWGDYTGMAVDPLDDCTLWFTTDYSKARGDWSTRIISVKFPGCK